MKTEFDTRKVCGALARDHSTKKLWEHNAMNLKQEGTNMNNQAKDSLENATARPWEANTESDASLQRNLEVIRSDDKVVAFTGHPDFDALPDNERKANAALIVRCVNSHDALVEACYLAVESLENEDCRTAIQNEALKSALNALKLAKGA